MYAILTESGLAVTHDTTRGRVYNPTKCSGGHYRIRNDNGILQDVFERDFIKIPNGTFVGYIPAHHAATFVGIIDHDYTRDKPYVMDKLGDMTFRFYDDKGDPREVFHQSVEVIADPWGVIGVPKRVKFFPQRRLRLHESVGPFKAGDDVFADRTNINGSYMVPNQYGGSVIVKPQICTVVEPGKISEVTIPEGFQVKNQANLKEPKPFQIQDAPKRVKKQKEVAQELMEKAYIMSPHAFLAGGALRNWHLGMVANDLDIFVRKPYQATEATCKLAMELMGVTGVFNKATETSPGVWKKQCKATRDEEKRASDQRIEFVLEGQYMGETVQFIFLEQNCPTGLTYCHRYFDTSINMISAQLNHEGKLAIDASPRFEDSMKSGVIFVQENGSAYGNGDHLERIHKYFPEAPLVREKYRSTVMRNPMKAWELAEDWEDLI